MNEKSIKDTVYTGLMIALIFVAASVIKIPTFGGFTHLGDSMVFLSVIVLGKKRGAFASATGMALVDILGGYGLWAPFTFVIKGVMAYVAGEILEKLSLKAATNNIIAFGVGAVVMIGGYFFAGTIMAGFLTEGVGFIEGSLLAIKDVPWNILQGVVGIAIAMPLSLMIEKSSLNKYNLNNK
ncbi:MAG: ECF transporter S component [Clostridium sp.]